MAKIRGFAGNISGRVGDVVFSLGDDGSTIMKKYQPVVANPRTTAQLAQRAKMNVVGQFVGMCPNALLAPLGRGSNRMNRADISSRLLKASTVRQSEETFQASFPPTAVRFARGNQVPMTSIDSIDVEAGKVTLTCSNNVPAGMLGSYGDRFVVGVLSDESNTLYDGLFYTDHVVSQSGEQTVIVDITEHIQDGQTVVVWRVPFVLDPAGRSLVGSDVFIEDVDITAALSTASGATIARWGETYVAGVERVTLG